MSRKSIFAISALTLAAVGTVGAVALKHLKNKQNTTEEQDDEVHFIKIEDGEESEEEASDEVKEVAAVYPYLKASFIDEVLSKNTEFTAKYEDDMLVTVSHHVTFPQIEERKAFVDIMEVGGYETIVDGDCVIASRKFFTQNGAIVSDILNVANQTNALQGTYDSYDIH